MTVLQFQFLQYELIPNCPQELNTFAVSILHHDGKVHKYGYEWKLDLNIVKTLHDTGDIRKIGESMTSYKNSETSRLSEVKVQRRFHEN